MSRKTNINKFGQGYNLTHIANSPLSRARILAVAEAYISLTTNRPYRDPWDGKAALTEIGKYVRTGKFDPMVVDTLSEIVGELEKK